MPTARTPTARRSKASSANERQLAISAQERDIAGDFPRKDRGTARRRKAVERDLQRFLEYYFPAAFPLAWSSDHLRVIDRLQAAILDGGLFALGMPRGSGKSALTLRAALWALLFGHRRFVALVAATEPDAETLLGHLKAELLGNELLARDFRAVCHPVRRLEGNARRQIGQTFKGKRTGIVWGAGKLVLPTMPAEVFDGVDVSGAIVTACGLTGSVRGQSHTLATGEILRPDLVLIDDPQTRESATSRAQTAERLAIISGDVLGLAGPGKRITAVTLATIIAEGDLADVLLDRQRSPAWTGERTRTVNAWPTRVDLWETYRQLRDDGLRGDRGTVEAEQFYLEHQAEMDQGAEIAWPARFSVRQVIDLRDEMGAAAFAAEYDNQPMPATPPIPGELQPDEITSRINQHPRGLVPAPCNRLTAFVDLSASVLWWAVAAWEESGSGHLVDYGCWPDQRRPYYTQADASPTITQATGISSPDGSLYGALDLLVAALVGREWQVDGGGRLVLDRVLLDSGWQTELVHRFVRQSAHAATLLPSKGYAVTAATNPMSEWQPRPGERRGRDWVIHPPKPGQGRTVLFDSNAWKSFLRARLVTVPGERGALLLNGTDPESHRMLADHLCSERRIETQGRGRTLHEWRLPPHRPDNHWLDCLVGCCVAASVAGLGFGEQAAPTPQRRRVSFVEMQQQARARR